MKCAHCGSRNTQALVDKYQCLDCSRLSNFDGTTAETGMDADTRAVIEASLLPRKPTIVGNLADVQRGGAVVATGESRTTAKGVELPPNTSKEDVEAPHDLPTGQGGDAVTTSGS